jgi:hypothetical protein
LSRRLVLASEAELHEGTNGVAVAQCTHTGVLVGEFGTAYRTPNGGDAIALFGNDGATKLAVIDLTKMLNTSIVKRTVGGHACESGTLPEEAVSFVAVP